MTAAAVLGAAVAAGIRISVDGDRLVLSAARRPNDGLVEELRREKAGIIKHPGTLAGWSEEDWQALFDERAGVMEFDGGMSRSEAEAAAADEVARLRSMAGPGDG